MNNFSKIFLYSFFFLTVNLFQTLSLKAQLVPDFKVNDDNTSYSHLAAKVDADPSGNFVIVWQDERNSSSDSPKVDIYCQRYLNSSIPIQDNFRVNIREGLSASPDVAIRDDASFIICWKEFFLEPLLNLRIYNNNGIPITSQIRTNDILGSIYSPLVESDQAGNFVIVWENYTPTLGDRVFFQRFDSHGNRLGTNQNVSDSGVTSRKSNPSITVRRDGSFIICWQDNRFDIQTYDIYMQEYNSNGTRIGNNIKVNTRITDTQEYPQISSDTSGNFCIVWTDFVYLFQLFSGYCQFYNNSGTPVDSNFLIASNTIAPVLASRSNGDLAVGIYGGSQPRIQRMRNDRSLWGNSFAVSNEALSSSKILCDVEIHNNKIIDVWQDNRNGHYDIYCNIRSYLNPDSVTNITYISNEMPNEFELFQNYPNPFNPKTKIQFQIHKTGNVILKVFENTGKEIKTLIDNKLIPGKYEFEFDASILCSGIYYYVLSSGNFSDSKKMLLIK